MEMPATDGYGKAGSLEPGQDTKGQQSQTVATVRYPDKSESLGKYETRKAVLKHHGTKWTWNSGTEYVTRGRNQMRSFGVKY